MSDVQIKDKALYAVALMAAFLAFSTFKTEMSAMFVPIGSFSFSLLSIMLFFVFLLTLAVYLYGLEYVRYSFPKYQNFFLFRMIVPAANFVYTVAITFPLLVFVMWLISITPLYALAKEHTFWVTVFDTLAILVALIAGVFNSYSLKRQTLRKHTEIIEQLRGNSLRTAFSLFKSKLYSVSIFEAYRALEALLKEILLEKKGFTTERLDRQAIIDMAIREEVIESKFIPILKEIKIQRNAAVHGSEERTEEEARNVLNAVKSIIEHYAPTGE
ncbi:MAG: HEPN domain-containing protein [Candidatus Pacebacteria bacterium]|nr:HEPN domain-containing protein [Candidatus Paceibacterota bacterium]